LSPTGPVAGRFPDASHHHVSDVLRDTTGTIFGGSIAGSMLHGSTGRTDLS